MRWQQTQAVRASETFLPGKGCALVILRQFQQLLAARQAVVALSAYMFRPPMFADYAADAPDIHDHNPAFRDAAPQTELY